MKNTRQEKRETNLPCARFFPESFCVSVSDTDPPLASYSTGTFLCSTRQCTPRYLLPYQTRGTIQSVPCVRPIPISPALFGIERERQDSDPDLYGRYYKTEVDCMGADLIPRGRGEWRGELGKDINIQWALRTDDECGDTPVLRSSNCFNKPPRSGGIAISYN